MANLFLFKSSIYLGSINIIAISFFNVPLIFKSLIWVGVITSIWNHGTTSIFAKYFDRAIMLYGVCIDSYYIGLLKNQPNSQIFCITFLILSIFMYFSNKRIHKEKKKRANITHETQDSTFHCFAHVLLTFMHLTIGYEIHSQD